MRMKERLDRIAGGHWWISAGFMAGFVVSTLLPSTMENIASMLVLLIGGLAFFVTSRIYHAKGLVMRDA